MKTIKNFWFQFRFLQKGNIFNLLIFQIILIFGISNLSNAQTLPSDAATGSAYTISSAFSTVTGASVTIDATGIDNILVVSTFQCEMSFASTTDRDAAFRIADNSDVDNINSGEIHRSLSNQKDYDYGIGSVVHIFDVSAVSVSKTYILEHNITQSKPLTTDATIVAIALKGGTEQLKCDVKRVTSVTMSTSWGAVTGSETSVITTSVAGGFYVAASIESQTTVLSSSPAVAEWKLQYKYGSGGTWTDLTTAVERSMSNIKDQGIINLVGSLPDWAGAGDYYFRIAHKNTDGSNTVKTQAANIVAVSLGITAGKFPVFFKTATGVSTTNTSMEVAATATMTPTGRYRFIHTCSIFNVCNRCI